MLNLVNRTQLLNKTKAGVSNTFAFVSALTRTVDCNVAEVSECVQLCIGRLLTAKEVRTLGNAASGPTGNHLAERVFQAVGMTKDTDYVIFDNAPWADYLAKLVGWHGVAYVNYGVMIDEGAPVGSYTYRKTHAIGIQLRPRHPKSLWDYDPTFDGRVRKVPGHGIVHYPFGRQPASLATIQAAAAAFAGDGLVSGYTVRIKQEATA